MQRIIDITKQRYKRLGTCGRCGTCCIGEDCEFLEINEDKAACKIFDSDKRPLKCRLFPANPPIVFKNCSFYFVDTWENDRIIKDML